MAEPSAARSIILASASAGRRRLLEAAGVGVEIVASGIDESAIKRAVLGCASKPDPARLAGELARAKGVAVSTRFPDALVIGADQVLALDDEVLDKPSDKRAARAQLERLRGRAHRLLSAVALAEKGRVVWQDLGVATLSMRAVSDAYLTRYLQEAGDRVCQTVGAYEIEGLGVQLFDRIEGDHFTIVGLPLLPLLAELRQRGAMGT